MSILPNRIPADWPLLSLGLRPFFLVAGLWAAVSMTLWLLMLRGIVEMPTAFDPLMWHFHELLFGFIAAAIAGFLLTAIPNWTGRPPLQGWPLGALVLLWLLGRIIVAFSAWTGPAVAMAADLSFLVALAIVVGREIVAGRNWRNLPIVFAVTLLITANALIHIGALGNAADMEESGKKLGISVAIMLISLIGGRIIPSFTTNWLRQRNAERLPIPFGRLDVIILVFSAVALIGWIVFGLNAISGAALIIVGLGHATRLARWCGGATLREPLVWILHVGYAWLPVGLILLGSAAWIPENGTIAIHALTAGAMGMMILSVMTRASLGHSKRDLKAGAGTLVIYILAFTAVVARLIAPFLSTYYSVALDLAGGAWITAFALFVVLYVPLFIRR